MLTVMLVSSLFMNAPAVQAVPDTSVLNKVNFSTDVIYQIFTDRLRDGNSANNPTGALFSSGCTDLRTYCGGDLQWFSGELK